ncbi:MAG: Hsp70 family protein [Lachnospiraceae bacterium]|nr:Hsp70 family protein [Lachnospiraceae bacterium]
MAIIGIDLGTTYSLACVYRNGRAELIPNELGDYKTNSVVSMMEDGSVLVGAAAKERLITHPESTAASFKVWMGTERMISLGNKSFKPEELSSLVLKQILQDARQYLGEPVEEAVISVPAYFNDNQRCATKLAAQLAGLTVKRLINEPSAAALYYRHSMQEQGDSQMMVIDFGGGTLDVSIVECFENIIEITAIAGDNHLGGNDIDCAIAAYFCRQNGLTMEKLDAFALSSLYRQAEEAKIALSQGDMDTRVSVVLVQDDNKYSVTLTNTLLRQLCEPIFGKVRAVISRAMKDRARAGRINEVILVGGSAQLTVFCDYLEELFGRRPAVHGNTDEMVALGVGLCAGIKERAEELQDLVMTDVCPFSLGVATYNDVRDNNPHMAFLIQRSSMLPASHQDNFYTLSNNQQKLRFEIFQGEGYYAKDNLKLGELEVRVPPGMAGQQYATVTFTYDIDGILHVSARSSGGDYRERMILNSRFQPRDMALQQAHERISQIQLAARGNQEDQLLLETAMRLYTQMTGTVREQAAKLIQYFEWNRESGDLIQREKARREMRKQLAAIEIYLYADPLDLDFWADDDEDREDDE